MLLTYRDLAQMIDQTLLKPYASEADFEEFCRKSIKYSFGMVAINSAQVKRCRRLLQGSTVRVGAAIGFCLGQTTIESKVFETRQAIDEGADEIDYVTNLSELKSGNYDYVRREMKEIVHACREYDKTVKVIFENCYLTSDEKDILCDIALEICPDYIKTSTGFGTAGASLEDVRFMRAKVGNCIGVKAAGGIRTLDTALDMIRAGASRIGTSAGCPILDTFRERYGESIEL